MKHMTCVNHKQAQQVCCNPQCEIQCAYVCLQSNDKCRISHQSCQLASLPYLLRKSNKIVAKAHDFHIQKLLTFYSNTQKIMESLNNFLQTYHMLSAIKDVLDPHGLLEPKQKETIANFLNSRHKSEKQVSLPTLQRDLSNLHVQLNNYLQIIKEERKKNQQKIEKNQSSNRRSSLKSKVLPTAVKSGLKEESEMPQVVSKIKQKRDKQPKQVQSPSKVQRIQASSIRRHMPKPPFFSKITNDVQTINTFFYHKFTDVKLLFRASQNQFSVAKFHEKCDGITNTITILLTQSDKIIGGFTPLAWKSGGGEWYCDNSESTFLFSLSSGQRYPLVNKDKAIWCSQAFGPSFGYPDLQIADRSLYNSNSCANFPQCFNNGNYTLSTGSTQMFCGTKNGHFKVKQWEVYELMF